MSKSTHQVEVRGVDKTAGAFNSIRAKAAATGAQIKSLVGGAIAGAGMYLGFRSIKGGIDELGRLSDVAQKAGVSVEDLTKATGAMEILGIQNMGMDQFAKTMGTLAKNTGATGMEGFYRTIEEIAQVPDVAQRAQAATAAFGKSGIDLMPLINAAKDGTAAFRGVVDAVPGVTQAAADAGDAVSDAMNIAGKNARSIWLNALGVISRNFDGLFAGGIREAVSKAMLHLEKFVKLSWRRTVWFCTNGAMVFNSMSTNWVETLSAFAEYFKSIFTATGEFFKGMWRATMDDWLKGNFFGDGPERFSRVFDKALDRVGERLAPALGLSDLIEWNDSDINAWFNERMKAVEKLQEAQDNAVEPTKVSRVLIDGLEKARSRIVNDLIYGGSNAALKMQVFGPTYQSEAKKQTELLSSLDAKLSKLVDNTTGGTGLEVSVLDC